MALYWLKNRSVRCLTFWARPTKTNVTFSLIPDIFRENMSTRRALNGLIFILALLCTGSQNKLNNEDI
jgi:hypothetical protein